MYTTDNIRDEIIDVLSSVTNRSQALDQLESRLNIDEAEYFESQLAAYEFYREQTREEEALIAEAAQNIIIANLEELTDIAEGNNTPFSVLDELFSSDDINDITDEREQRQTGDTGRDTIEVQTDTRSRRTYSSTPGGIVAGQRSGENQGTEAPDSSSQGNAIGDQIAQAEAYTDTNPSEAQKEAGEIPAYKKILDAYYSEKKDSAKGDEILAYSIGRLTKENRKRAFDRFMNGEITAEEAVGVLKSDIPYTKEQVVKVLNSFRDGKEKSRQGRQSNASEGSSDQSKENRF